MGTWEDIPKELAASIGKKLPCVVPRNCFASSTKSWRQASADLPPLNQLPWLLVPAASVYSHISHEKLNTHECVYCLKCTTRHRVHLQNVLAGSRYIGWPTSEWIMVARRQFYDHILVNVRSGDTIHFPEVVWPHSGDRSFRMLIRVSNLSGDPSLGAQCFVANISTVIDPVTHTGRSIVCYNRLGFFHTQHEVCLVSLKMLSFIVVHSIPYLGMDSCSGLYQQYLRIRLIMQFVACIRWWFFLGPLDVPDAHLLATYLVISRGDLMMVLRYSNSPGELTSFFRVHILVPINQAGESQEMYMWQAVEEPDGRILFVARGCSMSFESVEHPEVDEGVYFLDDRSFNCWSMISNGAYSGRRYMANDNGFWSWKTKAIKRFPCGLECSEYSSPVWILHRA